MGGLDEDAARTTAWSATSPPTELADDDIEFVPRRRQRRWQVAIAGAGAIVAAGVAIAATTSNDDGRPPPAAASNDADQDAAIPAASPPPTADQWWTPPKAKRTSIDALAYAFPTVDESTLGAFFDKDLKPIYGTARFFEQHEPRRVRRDEIFHSLVKLRNKLQLRAGFDFLIARAGGSYTAERAYQLYRAIQVREVVFVDEAKRMREPPEDAVFYLAEVHRGHAYDMLVEGEAREVGAELDVKVKVPVSAGALDRSEKIKITHQGLGLEPVGGDAIFAMTPDEVRRSYRTTSDPVIVKLVFRTIPGRGVKKQELPTAVVLVEDTWTLEDSEAREFVLEPGRYRIVAESAPKGLKLSALGDMICTPSLPRADEYPHIDSKCTVTVPTRVRISNHEGLWAKGPPERVSAYIARLPE